MPKYECCFSEREFEMRFLRQPAQDDSGGSISGGDVHQEQQQQQQQSTTEMIPLTTISTDEYTLAPKQQQQPTVLVIKQRHLRMYAIIGEGAFGVVYKARWARQESNQQQPTTTTGRLFRMSFRRRSTTSNQLPSLIVAVKTLPPCTTGADWSQMQREARVMCKLQHENIVRMYGVCAHTSISYNTNRGRRRQRVTGDGIMLVMEHMDQGDLKTYLRNRGM